MTRLLTIGLPTGLTLVLLLADNGASADSLYRCVTDTEGTIYTDNPAQLERCTPMTASGAVTSLATVSSGSPPIGAPPNPPPMTQTPPEPTVAEAPSSAAPTPLPCPVGLNPLNPFSAPPCPIADADPPATITIPSAPDVPPVFPAQP